jgi:hypothetical protein
MTAWQCTAGNLVCRLGSPSGKNIPHLADRPLRTPQCEHRRLNPPTRGSFVQGAGPGRELGNACSKLEGEGTRPVCAELELTKAAAALTDPINENVLRIISTPDNSEQQGRSCPRTLTASLPRSGVSRLTKQTMSCDHFFSSLRALPGCS